MNSTFKISALAVLVSVGLTACSGYKDKSPAQSTPTVINKQDNIKKPTQPEKKAEQTKPATSTTKVEQPKPEAEAKPEVKPETKAEQPTPIPGAVSNKPGSTDLVAINPQQTKPEVKSEQKITQKGKSVTTDELPTVHFKNGKGVTTDELPEGKPEQSKPNYETVTSIENEVATLDEAHADKFNWRHFRLSSGTYLDISAMSNSNKQGIFQGNLTSGRKYTIANLPYSSYGYIGNSSWFYNIAPTGYRSHPGFKEDYLITTEDNTERRVLKPELVGSATYKGPVIKRGGVYDGTVTLDAKFANTAEESYVSGNIDSKSVGNIQLEKASMGWDKPYSSLGVYLTQADGEKYEAHALKFQGKAIVEGSSATYEGEFGGKGLNDVTGVIEGNGYQAVFGGTKQPK